MCVCHSITNRSESSMTSNTLLCGEINLANTLCSAEETFLQDFLEIRK